MPPQLVVVGGGVAGLAAARVAARSGVRVTVLEASDRLGGKILTEVVEGVPWEMGPDALVATKPRGRGLLEELGLLDQAVAPASGRAYLLYRGELRPFPAGTAMGIPGRPDALLDAAASGILTRPQALRALAEPLLPRVTRRRGRVRDVVRARFGPAVADRLVLPLVGSVLGTEEAAWRAAFPDLADARSLMRATRGRPAARFLGLRRGMGTLVEALARDLGDAEVRTGVRVRAIEDLCGAYTIRTSAGPVEGDAVVVAVPGPTARNVLASLRPLAVKPALTASAVVHLRYAAGALRRPLDAAGWVRASGEPGIVRACSWVNEKWPHLEEPGPHLRAIVTAEDASRIPPDVGDRVAEEVGRVMRATREPEMLRVHRWTQALPVPGTAAGLRPLLPDRIDVAGASYDGVGIPDCVAGGEAAARRLVASLRAPAG